MFHPHFLCLYHQSIIDWLIVFILVFAQNGYIGTYRHCKKWISLRKTKKGRSKTSMTKKGVGWSSLLIMPTLLAYKHYSHIYTEVQEKENVKVRTKLISFSLVYHSIFPIWLSTYTSMQLSIYHSTTFTHPYSTWSCIQAHLRFSHVCTHTLACWHPPTLTHSHPHSRPLIHPQSHRHRQKHTHTINH